jgi:hypothetical protein
MGQPFASASASSLWPGTKASAVDFGLPQKRQARILVNKTTVEAALHWC